MNIKSLNKCINNNDATNKKTLNFDMWTRLEKDACYIDSKVQQNTKQNDYNLSNFRFCSTPNIAELSYSQPNILFKDGYGWAGSNGRVIDSDSVLRNGTLITNPRTINQLQENPYLTTPYLGRGKGDKSVESALLEGINTFQHRSCNTLSEITINNYFQPLIPMMQTLQSSNHIVQEDTDMNWVRGGGPTRQIVKNIDYKSKTTF